MLGHICNKQYLQMHRDGDPDRLHCSTVTQDLGGHRVVPYRWVGMGTPVRLWYKILILDLTWSWEGKRTRLGCGTKLLCLTYPGVGRGWGLLLGCGITLLHSVGRGVLPS